MALLGAAAVYWRMSSELLAGLFSFLILDLSYKRLSQTLPRQAARWVSLAVFLVFAVFFAWMLGIFIDLSVQRVPEMVSLILPRLNSLATDYGLSLPGTLEDLRGMIIAAIAQNAQALTKTSGLLTKDVFEILASVVAAALFHLRATKKTKPVAPATDDLLGGFVREFSLRARTFVEGFETLFRIQIYMTVFRCAVLAALLLLSRLPWAHFLLVSTFLLSVIPVVGAFTSSALILAAALSVSFHMAAGTLVLLLILHQAEYLLYTKLAGAGFALPTWLVLLGLLLGEKCLGLAGLILAPVIIHYLREELRLARTPRPLAR